MRRFHLHITAENAAFGEEPAGEIARILREVANRIEAGENIDKYRNLHDLNGNVVGVFALKDEEEGE